MHWCETHMDNKFINTRSRIHTLIRHSHTSKTHVSVHIENNRYRCECRVEPSQSKATANMRERDGNTHNKAKRQYTESGAHTAAKRQYSSNTSTDSKLLRATVLWVTGRASEPDWVNVTAATIRRAHGPKPLFKTESSVYLRLVDVLITSCKQHKKRLLRVARLVTLLLFE